MAQSRGREAISSFEACLDRRIDNAEELTREVAAWEAERNASEAKVNWRFSTPDARIKLRKLYPSFDG